MNILGLDKISADLESLVNNLERLQSYSGTITSERLTANTEEKIGEQGSLSDRLANTEKEADIVRKTTEQRLTGGRTEKSDVTDEELRNSDSEIINRIVDDIIRNVMEK